MVKLREQGVFLTDRGEVIQENPAWSKEEGRKRTMAWRILNAHNQSGTKEQLKLKFDALVSPDNNYVNILQTAGASGLERFPIPYVLSNCHHTLCAVGGTINEDDHVFGLDNVKKYGGIFVPPYKAVLHQYMREMMAGCGRMILGSDSHTRYGALGTLGIGEGGGEVVKQLLGRTYDLAYPQVIAVRLTGEPRPGVGPQDVALALIGATFNNNFNKNKILEFVGPGIGSLTMEYRMGIDVMTTESAALSSIWCTDEKTREYLRDHGREEDYQELRPKEGAYYDGLIEIDLGKAECMMALPFHPSSALPIREFKENVEEILHKYQREKGFSMESHIKEGRFHVDQALVSGCSGGLFENIGAVADILKGYHVPGSGISLGINPASLPIMEDLMSQGLGAELAVLGVTLRPCICGPCFGVTDVPANNQISIRHVTRNYPNREGSKPSQGQQAAVCLMDARSIAATVKNGGYLTAATELDVEYRNWSHHFHQEIYKTQVFDNQGKEDRTKTLTVGPNIARWPDMYPLKKHLLLKVAGAYEGSVTTDELIPSGEASSFRSNPEKISDYMMITRDEEYVGRAKAIRALETELRETGRTSDEALNRLLEEIARRCGGSVRDIRIGSVMVSEQIGDGSSREQAASSQKVLGGFANIANEYATKRYRSNLINWGILPLRSQEELRLETGDYVLISDVREAVEGAGENLKVKILHRREEGKTYTEDVIKCTLDKLTEDEKKILLEGCLINYYRTENKKIGNCEAQG
ncbi:MAG: hydratase [Hungatella sp.]|nr:hydratase [Hungatella sp.]